MKRVLQISDIHLQKDPQERFFGIDIEQKLQKALEFIKHNYQDIDAILITGDLTHGGDINTYQRLINYLSPLNKQIYTLPGNHDNLQIMQELKLWQKEIITGDYHIHCFNSRVEGQPYGYIEPAEIENHRQAIVDNSNKYHILTLHHPPIKINNSWINDSMLKNSTEFLELLNYEQVKLVLFSHIHCYTEQTYNNIPLISSASLTAPFDLQANDFKVDSNLDTGFNLIHLDKNGPKITKITL
jgi:Icc protein